MERCDHCGLEITVDRITRRKIRSGFSRRYFYVFNYEEVAMCPDCLQRQQKREKRARIMAVFTLLIIFGLISLGFIMLYMVT